MKIIHISDLHFGMHHPFLTTSFLKDLIEVKPDLIIGLKMGNFLPKR